VALVALLFNVCEGQIYRATKASLMSDTLDPTKRVERGQNQNDQGQNYNNYNYYGWTAFSDQSSTPFSSFMGSAESAGIGFTRLSSGKYALSAPLNNSFSFVAGGTDFKLAGNITTNTATGSISPIFAEQLFVQYSKSRFLWMIGDVVVYMSTAQYTLVNQSSSCYYIPNVVFSQQARATGVEKDISVALQMNPFTGVFRWVIQYFAEYFGDFAADCVPVAEMSAVTQVTLNSGQTVWLPYFVPYAQVFPIYFAVTGNFNNASMGETIGDEAWAYYGIPEDSDFTNNWDSRCTLAAAEAAGNNYYTTFFTPFGFCVPGSTATNGVLMPMTPTNPYAG